MSFIVVPCKFKGYLVGAFFCSLATLLIRDECASVPYRQKELLGSREWFGTLFVV